MKSAGALVKGACGKVSLRLPAPALTLRREGVLGRDAYQGREAVNRNKCASRVHPEEKPGSWVWLPLHRSPHRRRQSATAAGLARAGVHEAMVALQFGQFGNAVGGAALKLLREALQVRVPRLSTGTGSCCAHTLSVRDSTRSAVTIHLFSSANPHV